MFKGKEKTHWKDTRHNGRLYYKSYFNGGVRVCHIIHPIMNLDIPILPGDYSIPFSFKTPFGIPGSFQYSNGSAKASVKYKIGAILKGENESLKGLEKIRLLQGITMEMANTNLDKSIKMRTWCCFKKRNIKLNLNWLQDTYNPTQIADCLLEIDNTSSLLPVIEVSLSLVNAVRLQNNRGKTIFNSQTLCKNIYKVSVMPGEVLNGPNALKLAMNLPEITGQLVDRLSTHGKIIECCYFARIRIKTEGLCKCCGDTPEIESSFVIVPNVVDLPNTILPPTGWNPNVYEPVFLEYNERFESNKPLHLMEIKN